MRLRPFYSFLLASLLWVNFSFAEITQSQFSTIQTISNYFLKLCPPAECVLVGIGRSPTPIIAYFQSDTPNYAWGIPLSNFRYGIAGARNLSSFEKRKLFEHFDRVLPSESSLKGKRILLTDFSNSGNSVASAYQYLKEYLKTRGEKENKDKPTLIDVAVLTSEFGYHRGLPPSIHYSIVIPDKHRFFHDLYDERFDKVAPYGPFNIEKASETQDTEEKLFEKGHPSPAYTHFVKELSEAKEKYPHLQDEEILLKDNHNADETSVEERRKEAYRLQYYIHKPDIVERFKKALTDDDQQVRIEAMDNLRYVPFPERAELTEVMLDSKDQILYKRAVKDTFHVPQSEEKEIPAYRYKLALSAFSPSRAIDIRLDSAGKVFELLKYHPLIEDLLIAGLKDPSDKVKLLLLNNLDKWRRQEDKPFTHSINLLKGATQLQQIFELGLSSKNPIIVNYTINLLQEYDTEETFDVLNALLESSNKKVSQVAAQIILENLDPQLESLRKKAGHFNRRCSRAKF